MPSLRASSDARRVIPTPEPEPGSPLRLTPPNLGQQMSIVPPSTSAPSAFMQGSLPPQASGADVYVRQFYRGGPRQRRYMPVSI
jgi:hypothetical protein